MGWRHGFCWRGHPAPGVVPYVLMGVSPALSHGSHLTQSKEGHKPLPLQTRGLWDLSGRDKPHPVPCPFPLTAQGD